MKTSRNPQYRSIKLFSLVAVIGFCLAGQSAMAATKVWNVASGDWNLGTNWSGVGVPNSGDNVNMNNNGLLNVTDTQASATMNIGYSAGTNNRMVIANTGTLTSAVSGIGYSGATTAGAVTVDGRWNTTSLSIGNSGIGSLTINNGGSVVASGLTSVGVNATGNGALTIQTTGSLSSAGITIGNTAGSIGTATVAGTWTSSGALVVGNSGTGNLTVESGGLVTSAGDTGVGSATSGTGYGSVLVRGTLSNTGSFRVGPYGSGVLTIGAGGIVNVNGGANELNFAASSASGSGVLNIGGVVNGITPGTAEGAGVLNASAVSGRTSGGGSGAVNFNHTNSNYYFTKTGLSGGAAIDIKGNTTVNVYAGTTTLTGANTYTGATTVTAGTLVVSGGVTATSGISVSGGTLELGAANVLNNAAPLALSGGTFSTGAGAGFSETLGTVDLNTATPITLALGTGVHTLNFANSSAIDWAGSTLTITGWTGTAGASGTAGRIFFGNNSSGLTSGQLNQINFTGFSNGAAILSTGEIVAAVPEPTALTLLAAGLTVLVTLRRRRSV